MLRGIERGNIVNDDDDRENFLARMGKTAQATSTSVYAWALMDNHAHILLRSGTEGLPVFMRRFLTGYAVAFNRRHDRYGHLFQNRYKSIVCEEDAYFKELVRYIHLNPLRAGIVASMGELDRYAWCGHSAVMGQKRLDWQDVEYVLEGFGKTQNEARVAYQEFVQKGIAQGRRPDLVGGGLIRSMGGWSAVKALRASGGEEKGDERVLGSGDFVEALLQEADERIKRQLPLNERIEEARRRVVAVCRAEGVAENTLTSGSRRRRVSSVRRLLAMQLTGELGLSLAETARQLGVSTSAVWRILKANKN
jgi:REP element-mobilizing transposase RayT/predicted DNA-binding protein (UPF0251 family)